MSKLYTLMIVVIIVSLAWVNAGEIKRLRGDRPPLKLYKPNKVEVIPVVKQSDSVGAERGARVQRAFLIKHASKLERELAHCRGRIKALDAKIAMYEDVNY